MCKGLNRPHISPSCLLPRLSCDAMYSSAYTGSFTVLAARNKSSENTPLAGVKRSFNGLA